MSWTQPKKSLLGGNLTTAGETCTTATSRRKRSYQQS
jgi:hypothetical protein